MKRILILAVLLMLLAAPVLADKKFIPNDNSRDSIAYAAYSDLCGYGEGYSEIGLCASYFGGPHNLGISVTAHDINGPGVPP